MNFYGFWSTVEQLTTGDKVLIDNCGEVGEVVKVTSRTVKVRSEVGRETTFTEKGVEYGKSKSRFAKEIYQYTTHEEITVYKEDRRKAKEATQNKNIARNQAKDFIKYLNHHSEDWIAINEALKPFKA